MGHILAFSGPVLATALSFVFWTHKNKVRDQKELLDNINKINTCVVELTTDIKQVQRFNEHFHGCLHEVKDRINMIENRLWEHTEKSKEREDRSSSIKNRLWGNQNKLERED